MRRGAAAIILVAILAPRPAPAQTAAGSLRGVVYDKDFQVPLSGVRVAVAGTMLITITGSDGAFLLEKVPEGTHTLTASKDGYERDVVPGVVVTPGRLAELRVELSAEIVEMDEMVVTGADLPITGEIAALEIRETAISVQDAISSEIMKKAGVSDVAGALKLVVGASVSEGKYATVRGLSDRYTGTTLNGVRIPSADPRRRAVQIDMFPTGTIENLTVTKTFTPDLQGDFTGGGLDIKTRTIPDGTILSVSGSLEHNTLATGEDFLTYVGGGVDTLGFAGDERALPSGARDTLPAFPTFPVPPATCNPACQTNLARQMEASAAYDRLVRSFEPVMGVQQDTAPLNTGFSITAGRRFETQGKTIMGVLGSINQTHKYDSYTGGVNNNAVVSDASQGIALTKERTDSRSVDEVLVGGLVTFVVQAGPNHDFSTRVVVNQSAEDEARLQIQEAGFPSTEQNQSLHYTERGVASYQLSGGHRMPGWGDLSIDWTGSYNTTRQEEPDVRFFRNVYNLGTLTGEMPANSTNAQNTRRIFREVDENNTQGMVNLSLPFEVWAGGRATLKGGLFHDATDRDYEQLSYTYLFPTQAGSFTSPDRRDNLAKARFAGDDELDLWTDVFLFGSRIGLAGNTPPAPNQLLWSIEPVGTDVNYTGDQTIGAAYAMADLPLMQGLKAVFGARYETTSMEVLPFNELTGSVEVIQVLPSGDRQITCASDTVPNCLPAEAAQAEIDEVALLPSVGLVWEPRQHMNIRGTWSRTLARPNFRELAPVATEEFIFGDEFVGNPALKMSSITNYDLRWEWFRRSGEVLSASVFYKSVEDPIELISFAAGGRTFVQPVNFEQGEVYGFEVEARLPLDMIHESVKDITVGVNYTQIHSEAEVPEEEQESLAAFGLDEETRRLQGQPDYLLNFNVAWENDRLGTTAGLFYNLTGEMLRSGAARGDGDGVPNVFEESYGILNFTFSQKVQDNFSMTFKASNLLAEDKTSVYRTPGGLEEIKSKRETPVLYSLSGSYSW